MKGLIIFLLSVNLFANVETALIKTLSRVFAKDSIEIVAKTYGDDGLKALNKLSPKYGKNSITKLKEISSKYGQEGIKLVSRYGDMVVKNPTTFKIVEKFKDKGFYLIKRFPQRSVEYFQKFGDNFVILSEKFGASRIIKYLDEAKKYNADSKIIKFLNNFGSKGVEFLERNWGKLLASGFVLLNADSLIESAKNIANTAITTTGEVATESVKNVANSDFGLLAGIALILFVFFKYGFDLIFNKKSKKEF